MCAKKITPRNIKLRHPVFAINIFDLKLKLKILKKKTFNTEIFSSSVGEIFSIFQGKYFSIKKYVNFKNKKNIVCARCPNTSLDLELFLLIISLNSNVKKFCFTNFTKISKYYQKRTFLRSIIKFKKERWI